MSGRDETMTAPAGRRRGGPPMPGVLLVFAGGAPDSRPVRWEGKRITVGRGDDAELKVDDKLLSRRHLDAKYLGERRWSVGDLGSHNGTFVNGARIEGETTHQGDVIVVRAGGATVILLFADMSAFGYSTVLVTDRVTGPASKEVLDAIANAASAGANLLVQGESGTGKEFAAKTYHAKSRNPRGPFIAVNCAEIPKNIAEAELFGAKKGAFSGADADRLGYFGKADGGTLFLDEIGTLDLELQPKLLRVVEQQVVQPLGGGAPKKVNVGLVCATNEDLREAVERGRFRRDLLARIAQERVELPPLRARPEEMAHLVMLALREAELPQMKPTASFIEACLLREWPANVRELIAEVQRAARRVAVTGEVEMFAEDLDPLAGKRVSKERPKERTSLAPPPGEAVTAADDDEARVDELVSAYIETGSVDRARARVGMSRSAAYRWLRRRGVLKKDE
jgi:transcriptional regulator with GAF, ATPase, and Fis domain